MKTIKHLLTIAALGLLTFTASAQSWITNGLVAYYPFNGNANDASGNGHNGTVYGATLTTNRFGNPDAAYYFNGSSAYITAPLTNTIFNGDFTASVWFNVSNLTHGWPGLLDEQNQGFRLSLAGDDCGCGKPERLVSYSSSAPGPETPNWSLSPSGQTPVNKFQQVVVTKAGTNVTMFVNGQVVATNQVANSTTQPGRYLFMGVQYDLISYTFFSGVLDDVRIYNRALSTNEVAQLYALESAPIVNIQKAVYLTSSNLWTGSNYQVQASSDLINWTNQGSVFTATNSSWRSTNYWDVANWNQLFFRLQQQ